MNYWIKCLKCLHESGRIRYGDFARKQIKCITLVVISSFATIMFPSLVSKIIDNGIGSGELENIYIDTVFSWG